MAYQTYTGYTEVDAPGRLTVAANQIDFATLDDDEASYAYKDFTASHFSGDYECRMHFKHTAGTTGTVYLWGMTNTIESPMGTLIAANNDLHCLSYSNNVFTLTERNDIASTTDTSTGASPAIAINTDYYIRICRDEATGINGTLYAYIYTDSNYQDLCDILTVTLTENKDFQYLWAVSGAGNGGGGTTITGLVDHLLVSIHPYTLENLITRIRDLLNEDTATFWSDTELIRIINDVVREIGILGKCIERTETISTTSGTRLTSYTSHTVVFAEYLGATPLGLIRIHPKQVGHVPLNGTTPQYYFIKDGYVGIEPLPDATYSIRLYTLDYPSREMSINTELPELPEEYRPLIIPYALHLAIMKEGKIHPSQQLLSMFNNEMQYNYFLYNKITKDGYEDMKVNQTVKVTSGNEKATSGNEPA